MHGSHYIDGEEFIRFWKGEVGLLDRFRFRKGLRKWSTFRHSEEGMIAVVIGNHSGLGRTLLAVTSHGLYMLSPFRASCVACDRVRLIHARAKPPHSIEILFRDKQNPEELGQPLQLDNVD